MNGHKLEDLLLTLANELNDKSENILKIKALESIADSTVESNSKIIDLLIEAREIQIETMKNHDLVRTKNVFPTDSETVYGAVNLR